VKAKLAEVFGDTQLTYGTRGVARASARYQPKTFRCLFRAGNAAHANDTPYVFGTLPASATDDDRFTSELQMTAWTRFAATGDPNGDGVPAWPAYEANADAYLEISSKPRITNHWHSNGLDFVDRYFHSHCRRRECRPRRLGCCSRVLPG
jgi:carboxylesterase type B